jgi:sigma-E factor negative regulatory protein RseA
MEDGKINREHISTLADGELEEEQINRTLQALRDPSQHATWDVYHQIGDAIRSIDMVVPVRADFSARMAARLEAEPTLLAPQPAGVFGFVRRLSHSTGTWAAVAAATLAFVIAPQMMPTRHSEQFVHAPSTLVAVPSAAIVAEAAEAGKLQVPAQQAAEIQEYILVHQNSYPSLYGPAQLARPAILNDEPAR